MKNRQREVRSKKAEEIYYQGPKMRERERVDVQ